MPFQAEHIQVPLTHIYVCVCGRSCTRMIHTFFQTVDLAGRWIEIHEIRSDTISAKDICVPVEHKHELYLNSKFVIELAY